MFCGSKSFSHMDDDDPSALVTTPRASQKRKKKRDKNPYAARGLDKFSVVLAELQARREKIIARTGAQGVAMIRFMYDNSQDWIPIIVRPKQPRGAAVNRPVALLKQQGHEDQEEEIKKAPAAKKSLSWCSSIGCIRRREGYYWPLALVLILLSLVVFGRVFAICCTSVWWYMVPTIHDHFSHQRRSAGPATAAKKMKDFNGRRAVSSKNLVVQSSFKATTTKTGGNHGTGKKG